MIKVEVNIFTKHHLILHICPIWFRVVSLLVYIIIQNDKIVRDSMLFVLGNDTQFGGSLESPAEIGRPTLSLRSHAVLHDLST